MLWTSVSDTLLTFLSWISLGISKTSTPKLAYFSLSLPSMLRYLLPASPERGPVGWTVRLLEATTSTTAWVGLTRKLAKRKQATKIERILIGGSPWIAVALLESDHLTKAIAGPQRPVRSHMN